MASLAFGPKGRTIVSGATDRRVRLHDARTGRVVRVFAGHRRVVHAVAYSVSGAYVISGCDTGTIRIWSVRTGRTVRRWKAHDDKIWALCLSQDGGTLYSASSDKTVRVWDLRSGREIARLDIGLCVVVKDGTVVAVEALEGTDEAIRVPTPNSPL